MTKTLAKVFSVTKDEYDLIEDFIVYHGNIFGFENVHIIDNMSSNEIVLEVYKKYKSKGVTIFYESNYSGSGQGNAFTKYMFQYKNEATYLIGLDTDEFLYVENSNSPCNPSTICYALSELPKDTSIFYNRNYHTSVVDPQHDSYVQQKFDFPSRNITTFIPQFNFPTKAFFRSDHFISTSNGNHSGTVSAGKTSVAENISLLHFHYTGSRRNFERARMVVSGYGYVNINNPIISQIEILQKDTNSQGYHRRNQYLMYLMRSFILDCFVFFIKRFPSDEELNMHVDKNMKVSTFKIEEEFCNCEEKKAREHIQFVCNSEEKDRLLFFDSKLPDDFIVELNSNFHFYPLSIKKAKLMKIDFLRDAILNYTKHLVL